MRTLAGAEAVRGWQQDAAGGYIRAGNHIGHDYPATYATQWLEVLSRDFNHPAIVGWCPLNESASRRDERITTHDDSPATGRICMRDVLLIERDATRREIRTFDEFEQIIGRCFRCVYKMYGGGTNLAQVVRRNVTRHADCDAECSI